MLIFFFPGGSRTPTWYKLCLYSLLWASWNQIQKVYARYHRQRTWYTRDRWWIWIRFQEDVCPAIAAEEQCILCVFFGMVHYGYTLYAVNLVFLRYFSQFWNTAYSWDSIGLLDVLYLIFISSLFGSEWTSEIILLFPWLLTVWSYRMVLCQWFKKMISFNWLSY